MIPSPTAVMAARTARLTREAAPKTAPVAVLAYRVETGKRAVEARPSHIVSRTAALRAADTIRHLNAPYQTWDSADMCCADCDMGTESAERLQHAWDVVDEHFRQTGFDAMSA